MVSFWLNLMYQLLIFIQYLLFTVVFEMDIDFIIYGLISGFIATGVMSILQVPMYRKWGMTSVLEWHENQVITSKFIKKNPEELLIPSFLFHLPSHP